MNATLKPWGPAKWLFPKISANSWHVIASSSFEDRSVAAVEWLIAGGYRISSSSLFRIKNPSSSHWEIAKPKVDANFQELQRHLAGPNLKLIEIQLLSFPSGATAGGSLAPVGSDSVVLDVSTLPKRFFLYALRRLIADDTVRNLVITYSRAARYPEAAMCEDALPPAALQGFARTEPIRGAPRMVVGVGYVALSVEELLDKAKHSKLDFIFPFPPASPAFRRNWELLSNLMPDDRPHNTEIHRINGMDAFEVCDRLVAWGAGTDLDLLPLGPKPHALGMAMACLRLDGHAEIIYSQPQAYISNYSEGIAVDVDGQADIVAYCLKYQGQATF